MSVVITVTIPEANAVVGAKPPGAKKGASVVSGSRPVNTHELVVVEHVTNLLLDPVDEQYATVVARVSLAGVGATMQGGGGGGVSNGGNSGT